MKKLLLLPMLLFSLGVSQPAHAAEILLGTITATTTQNNSDTAVPFTISYGIKILVQCDAAAYLTWGKTSSIASTSSTGTRIDAYQLWDTSSSTRYNFLAVLPATGTVNCLLWWVAR